MAGFGQSTVERLRGFLRELAPGSRALLIAELERSLLRGDEPAGAQLILTELRRAVRGQNVKASRVGDAARLFFHPLEPFLVDDVADHRHPARVTRGVLEPVWRWIANTAAPQDAAAYAEQVEEALLAGDTDRAELLARGFQDRALPRMLEAFSSATQNEKGMRRLGVQIESPRAAEDIKTIAGVLRARDPIAVIGSQLPAHIQNLAGPSLDQIQGLLDSPFAEKPEVFVYGLVLVMGRLAAPWQLIRLATRDAASDDAERIAQTRYALAVDIVLAEIGRMVSELASDLKSGRGVGSAALLKNVHDAVRGLRTELDLALDSPWSRQLAAIRADISKVLTAEIDLAPGRVGRLLRPRSARDIAPGAVLDADEVTETGALIGFVMACRNYASELAINEVTLRTLTELQHALDTATRTLLDAMRGAAPSERPFRQSQVAAAVMLCSKVFGQEYAALLAKAAEVAAHDERKRA